MNFYCSKELWKKTWRITCIIPLLPVMYKSYKQTKTSLHVYKCTTNDIFLLGEHFEKKNKQSSFFSWCIHRCCRFTLLNTIKICKTWNSHTFVCNSLVLAREREGKERERESERNYQNVFNVLFELSIYNNIM